MKKQDMALLRVCAKCEWIFKLKDENFSYGCPKCGFAHYSAIFVYGKKCYKYSKTQEKWIERRVLEYRAMLERDIENARQI